MTPDPDSCPADRLAQRKAVAGRDPGRERRMAALQALTFAVTVASGVYFTGVLVRDLTPADALGWAALGAVLGAAIVAALRMYFPADVRRGQSEPEDDTDDDGGWDVGNAVLAAIIVPVFFVGALLARQWLLLVIVLAVSLTAEDATAGNLAATLVCSLIVCAIVEVGVVWPLARRWDLPFD